jgi:hypothetical protein
MKWLSSRFLAVVTSLVCLILVLSLLNSDLPTWLRQDAAGTLLDNLQKSATVLVVLFAAFLAYIRFFAYGFVLYLADAEISVDVLPHSKQFNLHFINLKASNRGTFRLKIDYLSCEATNYPENPLASQESGVELVESSGDKLRLQIVDRGETIKFILASRLVDVNAVTSSSYFVTMKASGRIWYSSSAVSNRLRTEK